jgi:Fe-S-cluster containining protein
MGCEHCGACCKGQLIVEANELDLVREPRLAGADITNRTRGWTYDVVSEELQDDSKCPVIAGGGRECRFLRTNNDCAIYATRPGACVAMEPGSEQCLEARRWVGPQPKKPGPKPIETNGYPWPSSRLNADDMHKLHLLSRRFKRPITSLIQEAVHRMCETLVETTLADNAAAKIEHPRE